MRMGSAASHQRKCDSITYNTAGMFSRALTCFLFVFFSCCKEHTCESFLHVYAHKYFPESVMNRSSNAKRLRMKLLVCIRPYVCPCIIYRWAGIVVYVTCSKFDTPRGPYILYRVLGVKGVKVLGPIYYI